jgi:hypothetical protein
MCRRTLEAFCLQFGEKVGSLAQRIAELHNGVEWDDNFGFFDMSVERRTRAHGCAARTELQTPRA